MNTKKIEQIQRCIAATKIIIAHMQALQAHPQEWEDFCKTWEPMDDEKNESKETLQTRVPIYYGNILAEYEQELADLQKKEVC